MTQSWSPSGERRARFGPPPYRRTAAETGANLAKILVASRATRPSGW